MGFLFGLIPNRDDWRGWSAAQKLGYVGGWVALAVAVWPISEVVFAGPEIDPEAQYRWTDRAGIQIAQDGRVVTLEEDASGVYRATLAAKPFTIGIKQFESTPCGDSSVGVVAQSPASDWNELLALGRRPAGLSDCIFVDSLKWVGTLYSDDGPYRRELDGESFAIVGMNCLTAARLDRLPSGTFSAYVGTIETSEPAQNLIRRGGSVQLSFVDLAKFCRQTDGGWSDTFGELDGADYDRVQLKFR